jgi:hypothetical protein
MLRAEMAIEGFTALFALLLEAERGAGIVGC